MTTTLDDNLDQILFLTLCKNASEVKVPAWYLGAHGSTARVTYDGNPLPIYQALVDVAHTENIKLERLPEMPLGAPKDARGYYGIHKTDKSKRIIGIITAGATQAEQARTLVHELAHHFTPDIESMQESDRAKSEVIAEAAAYIVGTQLGFNSTQFSSEYVVNWTEGFLHRLMDYREAILTTAARLRHAINVEFPESHLEAA